MVQLPSSACSAVAAGTVSWPGTVENAPVSNAIVQPEFVHVFRPGEESRAGGVPTQAGVVQEVAFRGANYELRIAACGEKLTAFRSLEQPAPAAGEVVQLYIARAKGLWGEETVPLSNRYLAK